jgi:hypothetical protein
MHPPPDPEMRSPATRQSGRASSQRNSFQQARTYLAGEDFQLLTLAWLPILFPLLCILIAWGCQ